MARWFCLAFAVIISGVCAETKRETFLMPETEFKECLQRGMLANYCLDTVCLIKKCLKEGYDLLYQNSSYSLEGKHHVRRLAHCAVDKCAEGIKNRKDEGSKGLFSGFAGPLQACLRTMSACVQNLRDEL